MKIKLRPRTFNRSLGIGVSLLTIISGLIVFKISIYSQPKFESREQKIRRIEHLMTSSIAARHVETDTNLLGQGRISSQSNLYSDPKYDKLKMYHNKGLELRRTFSCDKLFEGSKTEQEKVTQFHESHNRSYHVTPSEDVSEIIPDCNAFKTLRAYRSDYGSDKEKNFPLAYVILVHKDFEHVERLLRALYMPQHAFCIHVDDKAPDSLKTAISRLAGCFNNVFLASNPQRIVYAHMSRLMADVVCMKDLLHKSKSWRYLINMAATEFPLKTNLETVQILDLMHGMNDIHESYKMRVEARYSKEYEVVNGKMKATKVKHEPAPHNITVLKGQAYNTYSRAFVEWVFSDQKARDLLKWSEKTFSPDEHYWGTLNNLYHNPHLNTPGGFKGHPDRKGYLTKFISWQYSNAQYKCQGKTVHNICNFSALDLPVLIVQKHLAANKFDLTLDPIAYACMEEKIEKRSRSPEKFDLDRYKKLYFLWYKHKGS